MGAINEKLVKQNYDIRANYLNKFVEFGRTNGVWFVNDCRSTTLCRFDDDEIFDPIDHQKLYVELISVEEQTTLKPSIKVLYETFKERLPEIVAQHLQLVYRIQCEGIINDKNIWNR